MRVPPSDVSRQGLSSRIERRLARLGRDGLLRTLRPRRAAPAGRIRRDGRLLISLASNDYLGLSADPRLAAAADAAARRYGWGSTGSRLVTGTTEVHRALERDVARWQGREAALLLSSGYMANLSALTALAGEGDLILSDQRNHASLVDACRLSRADLRVYPHRDLAALEALLRGARRGGKGRRRGIWIVSDAVFSVDGDEADLPGICGLAERHGAWTYVDEAHAVGVYGSEGRGLADAQGAASRVDVLMGTFSKALGGYGAVLAARKEAIDLLLNAARPFVFTTALPAAAAAAGREALRIVRAEPARARSLWRNVRRLRVGLLAGGADLGGSTSQILPVRAGTPRGLLRLSAALERSGICAAALRPPTVPAGGACLRISPSAAHSEADMDRAARAIGRLLASSRARRGA